MPKQPKLLFILLFTIGLVFLFGFKNFFHPSSRNIDFTNQEKIVTLYENNLEYILKTNTNTVADFLAQQNISLDEHDQIIPEKGTPLLPGDNIKIKRAMKIKIVTDGKNIENYTLSDNISNVLAENKIILGHLDKISPDKNGLVENNLTITVTRINIEEKVIPEDIDFATITKTDNELGWRDKKTEIVGQKGIIEVKYKITYKNNKEVSRIVIEKNIIKEPIAEIIRQGTHIETGNAKKGQGTWYAFKGGLFAASTTIAQGKYARVINTANGKSVIVQINDYGPQGKGRIIDLDKIAFQKIASLGAGVIGVKVEEILN